MAIYTKTGDKGSTSLFDGSRVRKYDLRVDTYGTFDECCAQISVSQKLSKNKEISAHLEWIQEKIFQLNAEIATKEKMEKLEARSSLISDDDTKVLEQWIDDYTKQLPELHSFILPGRVLSSAQLHVARAVCRRGERLLTQLAETENVREEIKRFANRLSDCLYTLARVEDQGEEEKKLVNEIFQRYKKRVEGSHESIQDLNLNYQILQVCAEYARSINVPVSIALTDHVGNLLSFYKMPDALLVSESLAKKKAYSAVAMKTDTHHLKEMIQPKGDLFQLEALTNGEIVTFAGGLLLKNEKNQIIGGIGVSGGTVEEDRVIAQKGVEKVKEIYHAGRRHQSNH